MSRNAVGGLASIVIPCWNHLEFTQQCIAALVRHTRSPWELVVVDNGSTDGTGACPCGVQDAAAVPVTVISNHENRGFPAAINQGLQPARGEYLLVLNNDVVVTDRPAHQMMRNSQAAIQTCIDGLKLDPQDADLWFRKGVVHRHRGESADAENAWRRILGLKRPNKFCSVDQGIYGHLTRRNLAVLAARARRSRRRRAAVACGPGRMPR